MSDRGKELEQAVKTIESLIFDLIEQKPSGSYTFTPNLIRTVDGVRYEVDLHVKLHSDAGYESVFIFECKNRATKTSPEEITHFADKIDVFGAAHGFFISTGFSKYARAKALQFSRLRTLDVKNFDISAMIGPISEFSYLKSCALITYTADFAADMEDSRQKLDMDETHATLDGQPIVLDDFMKNICHERFHAEFDSNPEFPLHSIFNENGTLIRRYVLNYSDYNLCVNGKRILEIRLECQYKAEFAGSPVEIQLEVESRGMYVRHAPWQYDENNVACPVFTKIGDKWFFGMQDPRTGEMLAADLFVTRWLK